MPTGRILMVEDEEGLVLTLTDLLRSEGYEVESTRSGEQGFQMASTTPFDLVLLDVMLPDRNGFDVCRSLRELGCETPILMLTARTQVVDRVLGLRLGADDYLTKPFDPMELLARVEALRRRVSNRTATQNRVLRFGRVEVDFRSTEVRRDGKPIEMSAREFELLRYFIENRGATIPRSKLLGDVWGYHSRVFTRTVDVHVCSLRQKVEDDPKNPTYLLTVRGLGYKFQTAG
ncbi:MAG: DNA-binding response regulator [Acidobacteria bacterium]|nr:MAG: DNA-binding response regulator [Acidobacteriota bacterium]